MPLPPKPPAELPPRLALERGDAPRAPELRAAVVDELDGTEAMLLPIEAELTSPAAEAALAVAALARALVSAADLVVAATPPPVPEAWPEIAPRADWMAVLREAASAGLYGAFGAAE